MADAVQRVRIKHKYRDLYAGKRQFPGTDGRPMDLADADLLVLASTGGMLHAGLIIGLDELFIDPDHVDPVPTGIPILGQADRAGFVVVHQ